MKAEIITIGDEILIGQTIDTNSAWLAKELNAIGFDLHRITTVSDTREAILEALGESIGRSRVVLMTGGLGPTSDDITKPTLCEFFGSSLVMNENVLSRIEAFFDRVGHPILEVNRKQAELPDNADVLMNTRGTAQGMWFEKEGQVFISMPGVPYEMQGIMNDGGLSKLKARYELPPIIHHTILTQGIGESLLARQVADWEARIHEHDELSVAYLPSPGMVKVRITGKGPDSVKLSREIETLAEEFKHLAADHVWGEEDDKLEVVLGELLKSRNATLSTAESCTGGYIAHLITSIPGSSAYFLGGMVSYSNELKMDGLGVDAQLIEKHGAVSQEVVEAMAAGSIKLTNSDYSIACSGIAGPDGGTDEKPVGTVWVAIAGPQQLKSHKFEFGKSRERTIRKTALSAMNWLRKEIIAGDFE